MAQQPLYVRVEAKDSEEVSVKLSYAPINL